MDSFVKNRIGPVVTTDELQYRAELRLQDRAVVRLELARLSGDGARFRLRNTIVRADGRTAAIVSSSIEWLDLGERRLATPPDDLRRLVAELPHTEDFCELPSLKPRRSGERGGLVLAVARDHLAAPPATSALADDPQLVIGVGGALRQARAPGERRRHRKNQQAVAQQPPRRPPANRWTDRHRRASRSLHR
jgi:hypothetical protein